MGWHPEAVINEIVDHHGDRWVDSYAFKLVIHSTETDPPYRPREDNSYFGGAAPPHATIDEDHIYQHINTDFSSYALVHRGQDPHTNRGGAIQVEVISRAAYPDDYWSDALIANVASWIKWACNEHGIVCVPIDDFHYYPPEDGIRLNGGEPWRIDWEQWYTFNGICGHQHVPGQLWQGSAHGDPGKIPIARVIEVIAGDADVVATPKDRKVAPMYDPPLRPIVATCPGPDGQGCLAVSADGSVYVLHAPVVVDIGSVIGPFNQSYWGDREAALISSRFDEQEWRFMWTVTATSGETYNYPHAPEQKE